MNVPSFDDHSAWSCWQNEWSIREDTIYLNHGLYNTPRHIAALVEALRQHL